MLGQHNTLGASEPPLEQGGVVLTCVGSAEHSRGLKGLSWSRGCGGALLTCDGSVGHSGGLTASPGGGVALLTCVGLDGYGVDGGRGFDGYGVDVGRDDGGGDDRGDIADGSDNAGGNDDDRNDETVIRAMTPAATAAGRQIQ